VKNIPLQSTLDFSDLIGIPYLEMDCWQLIVEVYRRKGITLQKYYDTPPQDKSYVASLIEAGKSNILKVENPLPNDIFTARLLGIECHVGIYLGRGKILHTMAKSNCVVDSLSKWKHRITGFYRVE
jgi:cell wall-associated NlpC family hydrolase